MFVDFNAKSKQNRATKCFMGWDLTFGLLLYYVLPFPAVHLAKGPRQHKTETCS
jgi:hypothetical protein